MTCPARRTLVTYWLLTLGGFVAGVSLLWEYLAREHARLTPAQVALVWSSEAVAGFWFWRFGLRHAVRGRPLRPLVGRERVVLVGTLAAGWLLDAAVTGYKIADEQAAQRRAVATVGRLLDGTSRPGLIPPHRHYRLTGEYADPTGAVHRVGYAGSDKGLPGAAWVAVEQQRFPAPLPLRYAPDQPARYWLSGERTNTGKLANVSLMALAFQLLLGYGLVVRAGSGERTGLAEHFLPFGVSAGTLFGLGCTFQLFGSLE